MRTPRGRDLAVALLLFAALGTATLLAQRHPIPPPRRAAHPSPAKTSPHGPARPRGKAAPAPAPPTSPWSDRCVGVADGDTISVMYRGAAVRIRLNGVDCPEKHQAFGSAAKRFTSDLVFGKVVTVTPRDIDQYGRVVADVTEPDGTSLNQDLVAAGLAWWYVRYAPHDTRLQDLQEQARQAKRGLWADPHPVAPWDFRRGERLRRGPRSLR